MHRSAAVVSVDVDPIDMHLAGYGVSAAPDRSVYERGLPRLLDLFARHDLRATFFVVGRDAEEQSDGLRRLVAAGHEVASHSVHHPMPFARLPAVELERQLRDSREIVRLAAGEEVLGFRAPNWDVSPVALRAIRRAGYQYDASGYPTLLQLPARTLLAIKSRSLKPLIAMHPWPAVRHRLPYRLADGLVELPISTAGRLRVPLYHTARYVLPAERYRREVARLADRGEPFFYPLHAVDAMGMAEDAIDERLSRHPGLDLALSAKLDVLDESLELIASSFSSMTYRGFVAREFASGTP
jgi:peptidoglycan-N-acetylglucosamine deacetylase